MKDPESRRLNPFILAGCLPSACGMADERDR